MIAAALRHTESIYSQALNVHRAIGSVAQVDQQIVLIMNSSSARRQTFMISKQFLLIFILILIATTVHAETPAPTYEQHIRPILKARCFHCHGEEGKPKGGLDVRLQRFLVKGGDSGTAIVAGKPEESSLLERVKSGEMPPGDNTEKLSASEITLITRWIAVGAKTTRPEPRTISAEAYLITEEDRKLWQLAARMQLAAGDARDLSRESEETHRLYGLDDPLTRQYGANCLLARRLIERGVRFVQVYNGTQYWDHHSRIFGDLPACRRTDKPAAALVKDLKQRGLLDSTIVQWGGFR